MILNLIRLREIKEFFYCFKNKKCIYFLIFPSILGGPVGMAGYLLGVNYIGPSCAASFSALYPALGTILTAILLLEILWLSYTPVNLKQYPYYYLGMLFCFVCVLVGH